ncbi:hypothetical protein CEXT_646181 [Caerostris extrusa]|uniref:Uncharacterized protein n=1 Tax=Caerostris extrusa TaxID=172846 RepID=A0AAV4XGZ5_CAEEX|nr:hypothetical protein CEXT_646181 [Caerostris extrusa]
MAGNTPRHISLLVQELWGSLTELMEVQKHICYFCFLRNDYQKREESSLGKIIHPATSAKTIEANLLEQISLTLFILAFLRKIFNPEFSKYLGAVRCYVIKQGRVGVRRSTHTPTTIGADASIEGKDPPKATSFGGSSAQEKDSLEKGFSFKNPETFYLIFILKSGQKCCEISSCKWNKSMRNTQAF